ncbi:SMP-30/gluconolactonase/LRE family protein [Lichenifustis flavocetrariae]|uniref:SMP-30/gluconolactonase/LRE family protein n=1 Tax=Lichenifustis flavocetrariae TaxID=2949735 RepID=A0AA42CLX5_9HYPH|nr:SMP-30/gluconolactonase/LRE family protein [Lichenifustis flavocetrariae]MCW6507775.1 SMP-30/gluconolactonase/LRE family protein [Lichenifustis flavocetrariae]
MTARNVALEQNGPPPEIRFADLLPQVIRHAVLILLVVLLLAPLVWLLMTAFKPYPELFLRPPEVLPKNGTLVNFSEGWAIGGGKGIQDSIIVSTLSTVLCLVLGFPAAYALARRFPPHGQLSFTILSLRMTPPIVPVIGVYILFQQLSLFGMSRFNLLAEGLAFPEGPVVLPDGDLALVEISRGTVTRAGSDGRTHVLAEPGGGPNGAALGPDGALYICNNGGFSWQRDDGWRPIGKAPDNRGGRIERVDIGTGKVEVLYDRGGGEPLCAPNDIVFDRHGGFYFTDHGHRDGRRVDFGAVFYARADGSLIRQVAFPIGPNGIGLSPDGARLYVAETSSGRLWAYPVVAPGALGAVAWPSPTGSDLVAALPGFWRFDCLAVEEGFAIAIATLRLGGIVAVSPAGALVERIAIDDSYTTNICFGGPGRRTAFLTLSSTGRLVS